ncbi:hypothetical protein TWF694_005251 [Orbilia ellipsospora]|uniref:C2H2-type domain-containing protein n=1 Tax=Orbilia ellipsospora TaxID=2528407 RepID=A0AAV9WSM3_9PEZI
MGTLLDINTVTFHEELSLPLYDRLSNKLEDMAYRSLDAYLQNQKSAGLTCRIVRRAPANCGPKSSKTFFSIVEIRYKKELLDPKAPNAEPQVVYDRSIEVLFIMFLQKSTTARDFMHLPLGQFPLRAPSPFDILSLAIPNARSYPWLLITPFRTANNNDGPVFLLKPDIKIAGDRVKLRILNGNYGSFFRNWRDVIIGVERYGGLWKPVGSTLLRDAPEWQSPSLPQKPPDFWANGLLEACQEFRESGDMRLSLLKAPNHCWQNKTTLSASEIALLPATYSQMKINSDWMFYMTWFIMFAPIIPHKSLAYCFLDDETKLGEKIIIPALALLESAVYELSGLDFSKRSTVQAFCKSISGHASKNINGFLEDTRLCVLCGKSYPPCLLYAGDYTDQQRAKRLCISCLNDIDKMRRETGITERRLIGKDSSKNPWPILRDLPDTTYRGSIGFVDMQRRHEKMLDKEGVIPLRILLNRTQVETSNGYLQSNAFLEIKHFLEIITMSMVEKTIEARVVAPFGCQVCGRALSFNGAHFEHQHHHKSIHPCIQHVRGVRVCVVCNVKWLTCFDKIQTGAWQGRGLGRSSTLNNKMTSFTDYCLGQNRDPRLGDNYDGLFRECAVYHLGSKWKWLNSATEEQIDDRFELIRTITKETHRDIIMLFRRKLGNRIKFSGECYLSGQGGNLFIDHDHARLRPRGLLLNSVNISLPPEYRKEKLGATFDPARWWLDYTNLNTPQTIRALVNNNLGLAYLVHKFYKEQDIKYRFNENHWGAPAGTFALPAPPGLTSSVKSLKDFQLSFVNVDAKQCYANWYPKNRINKASNYPHNLVWDLGCIVTRQLIRRYRKLEKKEKKEKGEVVSGDEDTSQSDEEFLDFDDD